MKKLIALTGMMGSGKTATGKILAQILGYDFIDTDKLIENSQNKTIFEIFNEYGEQFFRKLEANSILNLSDKENVVVALGGGAFENETTRNFLLENSVVIYLEATPECIFERIKGDITRPLLHKNFSVETIDFILKKRENNYKKAHFIVNTYGISPEMTAKKIIGVLK